MFWGQSYTEIGCGVALLCKFELLITANPDEDHSGIP